MDNVSDLHRRIDFTIDGRAYTTTDHRQPAGDPLRLAGLDPAHFDLVSSGQPPRARRYTDDTIVEIHNNSRCSPTNGPGHRGDNGRNGLFAVRSFQDHLAVRRGGSREGRLYM